MNTIEFAVKEGVPYAIDFLNPAPDFERDRITEFYFEHCRRAHGSTRDRPRASRLAGEFLAALGRNAGHRRR